MAKAINTLPSGLKYGLAFLGRYGDGRGSVKQQVHDGDTVTIEADGNISIRFLGIDTAEVSFTLPGSKQFKSIAGSDWKTFLTDPFANAPQALINSLGAGLMQHLQALIGPNCATYHAYHAENAQRHLESLVESDMQALGADKDTFRFFLAFSNEVMDGYGRFLCFLNRNQEQETSSIKRPPSYNERMLESGFAFPYFIWPNINPFRKTTSVVNAVPTPGNIGSVVNENTGLRPARDWVRNARQGAVGIFENNKSTLEPFELRYLARQSAPSRWVIDLSNVNTDRLLKPTEYYTIPNVEDRLYIPEEYVPLFKEKGWKV